MDNEQRVRSARRRLVSARLRFALLGVIGIAAGPVGWLLTGELRWLSVAVIGLGAFLSIIPIHVVIRQVDKQQRLGNPQ